jgi:colicin import membrane protein
MTTAIQEYSRTDSALAELANRYKGVVYDVADPKGMQEAKAARAEIRGYRVDLEKTRVEIKAPALERCRLIDAEAKRITAALTELEDPLDSLIKNEEKRKEREAMECVMLEQRRIDGIRAQIESIRTTPAGCVGKTSAEIGEILEELRTRKIGPDFAEFRVEAEDALRSALAQVATLQLGAQAYEAEAEKIKAERAELTKLRAAAEARDKATRAEIDAEQRAAREAQAREDVRMAEERARLDAERREIQRREAEFMDAREMLARFVTRFGHLSEFNSVVYAIKALKPQQQAA